MTDCARSFFLSILFFYTASASDIFSSSAYPPSSGRTWQDSAGLRVPRFGNNIATMPAGLVYQRSVALIH
jgi:hypothetical protein